MQSARFDDPAGGEIDFFHNRLCFDSVCKHDPEMTNDLYTEWLRRAVPMRDDGSAPNAPEQQFSAQMELNPPLQKFSLIPYQDLKKGASECKTLVHMKDIGSVRAVQSSFPFIPVFFPPKKINFI
jgi:hypothetical protein